MKILEKSYTVCIATLLASLAVTTLTQAGVPLNQARQQLPPTDYTDRLIVKLRGQNVTAQSAAMAGDRLQTLGVRAGMTLTHVRPMSWGAQVLQLPRRMTLADAEAIAQKLRADPNVEFAEPDRIMRPLVLPNDTQFVNQWHYRSPPIEPGGVNLPAAWDITTGQSNIVIGLIDTGTLINHADLAGRTVPGYDFVSEDAPGVFLTANDGDGRDNNPTDPGDWITSAENASGRFAGCGVSNSSWHGTHIAGTIGAATNNGQGVAGINWVSKILPVRVLGKCGGYLADTIDGERWAAGLSVSGVPNNPNPAQVLNVSLGGSGACSRAEQRAISEIVALGKVIVVAAGNESKDAATSSPANCTGVITVAATNRAGGKTSYTNYGTRVDISAPGGQQIFPNDSNGILSTYNTGATSPAADDYRYLAGTSFSTSHVTGIVSLMLSVNPALTPAQVLAGIKTTARAFPVGSDCTTALCGAGIIDAAAAVNQVRRTVTVTTSDPNVAEEGLDPGVFTISRSGDTSTALTVYFTVSGTASSGADYNSLPASVEMPAGVTTATLDVTPLDDSHYEGAETVTVSLNPDTQYVVGTPGRATVTIADNEPKPSGGGGCTISFAAGHDPVLPLSVIIVALYLFARRYGWKCRRLHRL